MKAMLRVARCHHHHHHHDQCNCQPSSLRPHSCRRCRACPLWKSWCWRRQRRTRKRRKATSRAVAASSKVRGLGSAWLGC
jgi:hypothetical protein